MDAAVLFRPSKQLRNFPIWENRVLEFLKKQEVANSVEIQAGVTRNLSADEEFTLTDVLFVINRLVNCQRIEIAPGGKSWRLTKEERIRQLREQK